jgi:DnaJ-class molecular chaperone
MKIWNKSLERLQAARLGLCPKCKGVGSVIGDSEACLFCDGSGETWISASHKYHLPSTEKDVYLTKRWLPY